MTQVGQSATLDMIVDADISIPWLIKAFFREAIAEIGYNVVAEVDHEFNPEGYSAVWVIAESHISVHTWPEHKQISVDVFSCDPTKSAENFVNKLIELFTPDFFSVTYQGRYVPDETTVRRLL
ncbi:MAG: adenosylmethionine decarboxylase [Gammaproteobacteria bacterium]|nr:adenosylmethionine decarboxylase [Gammaproteobacteria bacterium]